MAIDLEATLETILSICRKANEMQRVVQAAVTDKVMVPGLGDINFTSAQRTTLVTKYTTLKSELATLYGDLP